MRLPQMLDIEAARKLQGRLKFQGLDISVENRAGSVRRGKDPDGNEWATKMHIPYGYIRKTEAADGDHVDCFVGPNKESRWAYVIHIKNPKTGEYDEDKVFLGCYSEKHARKLFDKHYDKPERFYQGITPIKMDDFKKRVLDKDNHGEKIQANVAFGSFIEPIPTSEPPSKKGKSRVPSDNPGEVDDKFLDVTKRKESEDQLNRYISNKAKPYPVGHTEVQAPTGSTNDYLRRK